MPSKIKARDIIAGWPRSQSTSRPYADSFVPWWRKIGGQALVYDAQRHSDDCENEEYHARQQAMFDDFMKVSS